MTQGRFLREITANYDGRTVGNTDEAAFEGRELGRRDGRVEGFEVIRVVGSSVGPKEGSSVGLVDFDGRAVGFTVGGAFEGL